MFYMGRFYVRSKFTHKSLPEDCVSRSLLLGRFYVRSKVTTKRPLDYLVGGCYLMARFYVRSKVSVCGRVGSSLMSAQSIVYVLHGEFLREVKVHT